jgi:hypothetical protein
MRRRAADGTAFSRRLNRAPLRSSIRGLAGPVKRDLHLFRIKPLTLRILLHKQDIEHAPPVAFRGRQREVLCVNYQHNISKVGIGRRRPDKPYRRRVKRICQHFDERDLPVAVGLDSRHAA